MERRGTLAGGTSSGRAGRPGSFAGTGKEASVSTAESPCSWRTASHFRAGPSISSACSAARRSSKSEARFGPGTSVRNFNLLLHIVAPPTFGDAHNHIGNQGEQEDHQIHPRHALQALNDGAVDFQGPALGCEREHLLLAIGQALGFNVALQRINTHPARHSHHQRSEGDVAMPCLTDAVINDAIQDTAYRPAESFHDGNGHGECNEKGGNEQGKEHQILRESREYKNLSETSHHHMLLRLHATRTT